LVTQLEAEKEAKGEGTPEEYKFDSNCITPGTGFMARLGRHLRFFIRKKLSEDPVWQQPVVIFSGAQRLYMIETRAWG
jgi:5'-3' exoribonuclease 1